MKKFLHNIRTIRIEMLIMDCITLLICIGGIFIALVPHFLGVPYPLAFFITITLMFTSTRTLLETIKSLEKTKERPMKTFDEVQKELGETMLEIDLILRKREKNYGRKQAN